MQGKDYLDDALRELRRLKRQAEKALAQVGDDQFFRVLDPESNSLAIIVKHLAGNLRSRWMDFLTSDGEKPDRNRDSEFVIEAGDTRAALMERWERGWRYLFDALESLGEDDLLRSVQIRGEPHSVVQAVNRQLSHYAAHVGQIVFLSKHLASPNWKTLSVPRGQSQAFNEKMKEKTASRAQTPGPLDHQH